MLILRARRRLLPESLIHLNLSSIVSLLTPRADRSVGTPLGSQDALTRTRGVIENSTKCELEILSVLHLSRELEIHFFSHQIVCHLIRGKDIDQKKNCEVY